MSRREIVGALTSLIRLIDNADSLAAVRGGSVLDNARQVAGRAERNTVQPMPWTPFEECRFAAITAAQIAGVRRHAPHLTDETARAFILWQMEGYRLFRNSRYQVQIREFDEDFTHLSIKRVDQQPVHDWRDLQRIKDELLGPAFEAVELYPARDRLVDAANQYHLWALRKPGERFPIGFEIGMTANEDYAGAAQRAPS